MVTADMYTGRNRNQSILFYAIPQRHNNFIGGTAGQLPYRLYAGKVPPGKDFSPFWALELRVKSGQSLQH